MAADPGRRAILRAAAGSATLLLTGCKGITILGTPPRAGPAATVLEDAITAEELLVRRYELAVRTVTGRAKFTKVLRAVLAQHQEHLAQLRARLVVPPGRSGPRPAPAPGPLPSAERGAAAALLAAEESAAQRGLTALRSAPAELAQLMASIAASEATHAVLLAKAGKTIPVPPAPAARALTAGPPPGAVAALQAALAAEQAAVYGYGVVGANLAYNSRLAQATSDWVEHQRARDLLTQAITVLGGVPRAASVAYRLPVQASSPASAIRLAATLEDRVAGGYLGLVALSGAELRRFGAGQMQACSVRAARWNDRAQAFPGLPHSALRGAAQ